MGNTFKKNKENRLLPTKYFWSTKRKSQTSPDKIKETFFNKQIQF